MVPTDFLQRLFRQGQAGRGILEDPAMSRESPPGFSHGDISKENMGNFQPKIWELPKKNIALLVPNLWESHKKHIYFFFHHFPWLVPTHFQIFELFQLDFLIAESFKDAKKNRHPWMSESTLQRPTNNVTFPIKANLSL